LVLLEDNADAYACGSEQRVFPKAFRRAKSAIWRLSFRKRQIGDLAYLGAKVYLSTPRSACHGHMHIVRYWVIFPSVYFIPKLAKNV